MIAWTESFGLGVQKSDFRSLKLRLRVKQYKDCISTGCLRVKKSGEALLRQKYEYMIAKRRVRSKALQRKEVEALSAS